jgi:hypothetical protein
MIGRERWKSWKIMLRATTVDLVSSNDYQSACRSWPSPGNESRPSPDRPGANVQILFIRVLSTRRGARQSARISKTPFGDGQFVLSCHYAGWIGRIATVRFHKCRKGSPRFSLPKLAGQATLEPEERRFRPLSPRYSGGEGWGEGGRRPREIYRLLQEF